jgi:hypothetical protein
MRDDPICTQCGRYRGDRRAVVIGGPHERRSDRRFVRSARCFSKGTSTNEHRNEQGGSCRNDSEPKTIDQSQVLHSLFCLSILPRSSTEATHGRFIPRKEAHHCESGCTVRRAVLPRPIEVEGCLMSARILQFPNTQEQLCPLPAGIEFEPHFRVKQIAKMWGLSMAKVRRIFENEPSVIRVGEPSRRLGRKLKRRYFSLRIPQSVVERVHARLSKAA